MNWIERMKKENKELKKILGELLDNYNKLKQEFDDYRLESLKVYNEMKDSIKFLEGESNEHLG